MEAVSYIVALLTEAFQNSEPEIVLRGAMRRTISGMVALTPLPAVQPAVLLADSYFCA
jgi:hypothetical protein